MEKLSIIFLQETKCYENELKTVGGKVWRGSEATVVDAKGEEGEIGILWNPIEVVVFEFTTTQFSLSATFQNLGTSTRGFMTNVYGPPGAEQKKNSGIVRDSQVGVRRKTMDSGRRIQLGWES